MARFYQAHLHVKEEGLPSSCEGGRAQGVGLETRNPHPGGPSHVQDTHHLNLVGGSLATAPTLGLAPPGYEIPPLRGWLKPLQDPTPVKRARTVTRMPGVLNHALCFGAFLARPAPPIRVQRPLTTIVSPLATGDCSPATRHSSLAAAHANCSASVQYPAASAPPFVSASRGPAPFGKLSKIIRAVLPS